MATKNQMLKICDEKDLFIEKSFILCHKQKHIIESSTLEKANEYLLKCSKVRNIPQNELFIKEKENFFGVGVSQKGNKYLINEKGTIIKYIDNEINKQYQKQQSDFKIWRNKYPSESIKNYLGIGYKHF